jgi:AraC family transcriptional regulator, transcriptional activator of pobA
MDKLFDIFKITHDVIKGLVDDPPAPHTHDHEEIIIATEGDFEHLIDFNKSIITAPAVVYVAQGKVHQFQPNFRTKGWAIRYHTEFIQGGKFHYYSHYMDKIIYHPDTGFFINSVDNMCQLMFEEMRQEPADFETIRNLLKALFAKLESLGKKELNIAEEPGNCKVADFNKFLKILEDNFRNSEGVEFYAGKMNMTVRNLNLLSKSVMNKNISEIIDTRKLIEARNLLLNTNKSVSEIGFELGYNEKSYFTRVFRLKTGLTPSKFREKMHFS